MSLAPLTSNWTLGDIVHAMRSRVFGDDAAALAEISERIDAGGLQDPWLRPMPGVRIIDRRNEIRGKAHYRGRPRAPIAWSKRRGMCVHQTGEGGVLTPDHRGILSIPAHMILHWPENDIVPLTLLHPLPIRMPHGHALNSATWGVEVDCRPWGIIGNKNTFPRKKREKAIDASPWHLAVPPHPLQLAALEQVAIRGAEVHEAHGRPFGIYTHAQGDRGRVKVDPGEEISLFCDAVRIRHGFDDVRDESFGTGQPWPEQWRLVA